MGKGRKASRGRRARNKAALRLGRPLSFPSTWFLKENTTREDCCPSLLKTIGLKDQKSLTEARGMCSRDHLIPVLWKQVKEVAVSPEQPWVLPGGLSQLTLTLSA